MKLNLARHTTVQHKIPSAISLENANQQLSPVEIVLCVPQDMTTITVLIPTSVNQGSSLVVESAEMVGS